MTGKLKVTRGKTSVFSDLGFPPIEAQNLQLRSDLMSRIEQYVVSAGLKQKDAAVRLGVTQPRLNDLMRGKIEKFSLDALVNMLGQAGMRVALNVKKPCVA